jgi:hypothetical protein
MHREISVAKKSISCKRVRLSTIFVFGDLLDHLPKESSMGMYDEDLVEFFKNNIKSALVKAL